MINLIHEAEIHGATVDEKTQVSVILESLTPAFLPFTTNYIMNKLEYNLTQLLNELQTFETISKTRSKEGEENVAQRRPSSSSAGRTIKKRRRKRLVGLEYSPIRDHPSVVGRKTTPRIRILRENVSTVELKVTGRETVKSISPG